MFYNVFYCYKFVFILSLLLDCPPPSQTDIAFLLDGSGSVSSHDFDTMKDFVKNMVEGLKDRDSKVCAERSLFSVLKQQKKANIFE